MFSRRGKLVLSFLMLLIPIGACFSPIHCPIQVTAPIAAGSKTTSHYLDSIEVFDGPPRELASLIPDEEAGPGRPWTRWIFAPQRRRSLWLVCGYKGTDLKIKHELPNTITQCEVTFKGSSPQAVDCS